MKKKYYDGFNVIDILFKNLEPRKMLKVLEAFSECDGVDAVEVIRCKDCKHYNGLLYTLCPQSGMNVIDDEEDYCCRAERKEQ